MVKKTEKKDSQYRDISPETASLTRTLLLGLEFSFESFSDSLRRSYFFSIWVAAFLISAASERCFSSRFFIPSSKS